ncbi:MAG: AI-2E family transporter [Gammaproteobacteria bacterium]|nr:AI-2E family transporter [Gammaproteobacteria bacterium]
MILAALYLARDLMLPVVMAVILSLVFLPLLRAMKRIFIPAPLGAGVIVLALLATFIGGTYLLAEPANTWLNQAPQGLREIEYKLLRISGAVKEAASASAQVEDMTKQIAGGNDDGEKTQEVVVKAPTLASTVVNHIRGFAVIAISTLVLLYFLLASEDIFLRKTVAATTRLSDKKRAVDIAQQVEAEVSTYLLTITIINIGLGCMVALLMYVLGVPNPLLWGVVAGVLNFIPYLGDIATMIILLIVGLLTFDELWRAALVPGAFYLLTAIEGYLLTPLIVGRRMNLNPVIIVLSVLMWGWMWGVPGALLAVPILVAVKTWCDRVQSLQVFGEFLGGHAHGKRRAARNTGGPVPSARHDAGTALPVAAQHPTISHLYSNPARAVSMPPPRRSVLYVRYRT